MSDSAAYLYTTDAGLVYQVLLPTDFGTALGFPLATGAEPYLPSTVSPRFATFVSTSPQLWRPIVIPQLQLFTSLPAVINVGGNNYSLVSTVGETFLATQGGSLLVAAGPQGPPGPPGPPPPLTLVRAGIGTPSGLALTTSVQQVCRVAVTPGTWQFRVYGQLSYGGYFMQARLSITTAVQVPPAGGVTWYAWEDYKQITGSGTPQDSFDFGGIITFDQDDFLNFNAVDNSGNGAILYSVDLGSNNYYNLDAIKVG
jgi:hypothetical protein